MSGLSGTALAAPDTGALRVAFSEARQMRAAGQYKGAIQKLRAILREVPDDNGVREELGYVLILDGQYAAAQYHFQLLAERSANPQKRALYRAVLRRILNERPVGISLVLSVVPSSNLNGGSSRSEITTAFGVLPIDDGSLARSGWRASAGVSGYIRGNLGQRDQLAFHWKLLETRYDTGVVEDTREVHGTATWRRLTRFGALQASFGRSRQKSDSETLTRDLFGLGGHIRRGKQSRVDWAIDLAENDYRDQTGKSGPEIISTLRYTWLLPRTQSIWIGVRVEDSDPELAHQKYAGQVLQVGGRKVFGKGVVVDATLSVGVRDFSGQFPAVTPARARHDRFHELSLSVQDSRISWQGFSPRATCRTRWNSSNIELFDATTHECALEFSRRF